MSNHTASSLYTPAELDTHEFFARAQHRKRRWYCTLCCRPEQAAVAHFDCRGASRHEASDRHKENIARYKQPVISPLVDLNSWALEPSAPAVLSWDIPQDAQPSTSHKTRTKRVKKSATPFANLLIYEHRTVLDIRDEARRNYNIRVWLKGCVLAEGGVWVDTADDVEPPAPEIWWDVEQRADNTWARTPTNPSICLDGHGGDDDEDDDVASNEQAIPASISRRPANTDEIDMDVGSSFSKQLSLVQKAPVTKRWDRDMIQTYQERKPWRHSRKAGAR